MPWPGPTADDLVRLQDRLLPAWEACGDGTAVPDPVEAGATLDALVEAAHFANFSIWRLEDQARRRDVDDARIAATKRAIDIWNQRRNDLMEAVDAAVLEALAGSMRDDADLHSETPGMILDRLGVLALKIRNAGRVGAEAAAAGDDALARECAAREATLRAQRDDLARCLDRLLADCGEGRRRFKRYFQLKSYNDERMNLALRAVAARAKGEGA